MLRHLTMRDNRLLLPLVILVTIMVFLPVCGHEFLGYDDTINITENTYLEHLSVDNILHFWKEPFLKLYIPLTYTLWSAQAFISRLIDGGPGHPLNPHLFHSINVLLHSATTALVFLLLRRLQTVPWAAAAGALLFAIHPVQVAPVAWATGLKDLLSGFWSVMALWQYTLSVQHTESLPKSRWRYSLALISFILAMLSKPNAVIVPLLAATIGFFELGQSRKRLIITLSPWLLCPLPIILMTRQSQPVTDPDLLAPLWQRFLVAGDAITFYLTKLALPINFGPDYGRTFEVILAQPAIYITALLPYLLIAYLIWKRPQPLFTSTGLFIIALLPVLGFIPFNFQQFSTVACRYLYLSMLGPAFAASQILTRFSDTRAKGITLAALVILAGDTIIQARYWRDPLTFNQHAVTINPDSWFFHNNLGNAYHAIHETEKAIESLNKSIALKPEYELPIINLAVVHKETGNKEKAIAYYLKALSMNPNLPNAHNDLAMVYYDLGQPTKAIAHLEKSLALRPDYDKAYANLGIVYNSINNPDAALGAYQRAVKINPRFTEAYINLGALNKTLGNLDAAITCFQKAIALMPNRPEAYNNLGLLYLETDQNHKAIPLFTTATETGEKSPIPWHNLGKALLASGRNDDAITALRQAITIDQGFAPAYNTLSTAYLSTRRYHPAVKAADQAKTLGLSDPEQMRAVEPYRLSP